MRRRRGMRSDLADVDYRQRIYVNRNLRLKNIRAIGFDMDHTLAVYKPLPLDKLAFNITRDKLCEIGYPSEVKRLSYQPSFVSRGLVVDIRRGNIMKMDRHRYVVDASHGTRRIPPEMRRELYASTQIRLSAKTYVPIDTLFSLPEISLYAQLVDLMDLKINGSSPNYRQIYLDVRRMMDTAHADDSIKSVIAKAPQRFIDVDPNLPETLARMKSNNIKLFLLTNSEVSYTSLIMEKLFGKTSGERHWAEYFDLILMQAGKPSFFSGRKPLKSISPRKLKARTRGNSRFVFTSGSVGALEKKLGVSGDEILYFGDHTYGDILKSKRSRGWRTAMIIKGLEQEMKCQRNVKPESKKMAVLERRIDQLCASRDFLQRAEEGQLLPREIRRFMRENQMPGGIRALSRHIALLKSEIHNLGIELETVEQEIDRAYNPNWGSIFRAGRETTYFAKQVEDFACIYTSRVSNFLNYPLDKYFVTTHVFMPHQF
jgi:HAD superfamily 5'-nucleotidase-like hydrolase